MKTQDIATKKMDNMNYQFIGKDFGLPKTIEEVNIELEAAEKVLETPSAWSSLGSFVSEFRQEHETWLR